MKLAALVFGLASLAVTSKAGAEPPKVGETYSCSLTFTVSVWSKTGVKERSATQGSIRELIKVLDSELEITSFFRDEASVGHYPIIAREDDDSIVAENPTRDGHKHPGRHVLYRMTDRVAVYTDESGSFRNAGGGVTTSSWTGSCRLAR